VADVGERDDGAPARRQQRTREAQRGPGVAQVLQHVGEQEDVEAGREGVARGRVLDAALDHLLAPFPRLPGRAGVQLEPDHGAAATAELRSQIAGRTPDVQHAGAGRHRFDHQPVAVGQAVLVDEAGVRAHRGRAGLGAGARMRSRTAAKKRSLP
jgi:hypothetical protein